MSRVVAIALLWSLLGGAAAVAIPKAREAAEVVVSEVSEFMAEFPNGNVSDLQELESLTGDLMLGLR